MKNYGIVQIPISYIQMGDIDIGGINTKKILLFVCMVIMITAGIPFLIVKSLSDYKRVDETETVSVYIKSEDKVCDMEIEQYIKEVTAAEMPADFELEALKAQAVAARTYLTNRVRVYKNTQSPAEHKGAMICTDSTHCKAWVSEEKKKEQWGEDYKKNWDKISDAVDSTKNLIITYNSQPISAVFHSTSSGTTENAKDVWGGDVGYLVSVKSEGDLKSPKFNSEAEFSMEEFKKIAQEKIEGVNWENGLIDNIMRSDAGGIKTLSVGGVIVKGTDFRFMYGLRSTNIEIEVLENSIKMYVKGYGHGVGMSQYGANYLAQEGKTFEEILKTYYSGVEITKYESLYE